MTKRPLQVLGAVVATGVTLGMVGLSRAPLAAYPDDTPVIRLAWSARPERIEQCRTLTDAELAEVPAHMRQRVQCEGRSANYRLSVTVDGAPRLDTLITGGGVRGDRPLYVFREIDVTAGTRRLEVRFERESVAGSAPGDAAAGTGADVQRDTLMAARATREVEERARRQGEAIPPLMELAAEVRPEPREVLLVTYDIDRRALVLRTRAPRP